MVLFLGEIGSPAPAAIASSERCKGRWDITLHHSDSRGNAGIEEHMETTISLGIMLDTHTFIFP